MPKDNKSSSSSGSSAVAVVATPEVKEYTFDCATCGQKWSFKINRSGVKRCKDCAEIRRALNGFLNRGITVKDLMARVESVLATSE